MPRGIRVDVKTLVPSIYIFFYAYIYIYIQYLNIYIYIYIYIDPFTVSQWCIGVSPVGG